MRRALFPVAAAQIPGRTVPVATPADPPNEDAHPDQGAAVAALPQTDDVDAIGVFLKHDFRRAPLAFLDIEPRRDKHGRVV
jgi:hypothetical protein